MAITRRNALTAASIGLDVGFAGLDYKHYRKNHYGRGGAFATAATYAGVGTASALATHGIRKAYIRIPAGIALSAVSNRLISRRVEKHFSPRGRVRVAARQRGRNHNSAVQVRRRTR
jgi:hypothetical protein